MLLHAIVTSEVPASAHGIARELNMTLASAKCGTVLLELAQQFPRWVQFACALAQLPWLLLMPL